MGANSSNQKKQPQAEAVERRDTNRRDSALCKPELRDPLTIAISFLANPAPFRGACCFTVECWDQAVFLEGELSCCLATTSGGSTSSRITRSCPISLRLLDRLPLIVQRQRSGEDKQVSFSLNFLPLQPRPPHRQPERFDRTGSRSSASDDDEEEDDGGVQKQRVTLVSKPQKSNTVWVDELIIANDVGLQSAGSCCLRVQRPQAGYLQGSTRVDISRWVLAA